MASDRRSSVLLLRNLLTGADTEVVVNRVLIAGFTGRDRTDVQSHVEELRAAGIQTPEEIPAVYVVGPQLLTTNDAIYVEGERTSGEIEPVVVQVGGSWMLCAGSDHTDRALEIESIQASKEACPKVVSAECFPVDSITKWDEVTLRSWLEDRDNPYQEGTFKSLLPLEDILGTVSRRVGRLENGDVVFLGTIPVRGGNMRPSRRFAGEVGLTGHGKQLSVSYRVDRKSNGSHSE